MPLTAATAVEEEEPGSMEVIWMTARSLEPTGRYLLPLGGAGTGTPSSAAPSISPFSIPHSSNLRRRCRSLPGRRTKPWSVVGSRQGNRWRRTACWRRRALAPAGGRLEAPGGATTAAGSGAPRPCRRLGRYSARARGGGGARAWWPVWRSGLRLDLEDVEVDWLISVRW
jgi:hypothetical protein